MSGDELEARVGRIEEAVGSITQMLQGSQGSTGGKSSNGGKDVTPSDPLENMTESEIEGLSNRDLIKLLNKQMQGAVQQINSRLDEELSETRDDFSKEQIARDLKSLMKDHPEIKHLKNEFKEVIQHSPSMPIEDMYALITAKHPDKVEAAKEKVKGESGEKKGSEKSSDDKTGEAGKEEEGQNQKGADDKSGEGDKDTAAAGQKGGSGGGMTPSGGGGSAGDSSGSSEGKSSTREAGDKAWAEVFGSQEIVNP